MCKKKNNFMQNLQINIVVNVVSDLVGIRLVGLEGADASLLPPLPPVVVKLSDVGTGNRRRGDEAQGHSHSRASSNTFHARMQ